eukprot:scaffold59238_cov27-Tisochrysis_lutea.AAC.2
MGNACNQRIEAPFKASAAKAGDCTMTKFEGVEVVKPNHQHAHEPHTKAGLCVLHHCPRSGTAHQVGAPCRESHAEAPVNECGRTLALKPEFPQVVFPRA